ncbi:MAG TPA: hypothetical protein PK280_21545 [Planctomycetota bacterium]|nr:hypothetical protein [Planctomycetota bacterium]
MAGLLYYVPGQPGVLASDLDRLGLRAALGPAAPPPPFGEVRRGPDGARGCVLAPKPEVPGGRSPEIRYAPDAQLWRPAPGGAYWVGRELAEPVLPEDLMRAQSIGGHWVRLEGGQDWLVPVARTFDAGSVLPHALVLGPEGQVVREPLERYAAISAKAERVWAWAAAQHRLPVQAAEPPESLSDAEGLTVAAAALGLNYRLALPEISLLRLVTDENAVKVLEAFVDFPSLLARAMEYDAASKKNGPGASAGSGSGAGGTGS